MKCLRCGSEMKSMGKNFHITGEEQKLTLEVLLCTTCGKTELYSDDIPDKISEQLPKTTEELFYGEDDSIAQIECPHCGKMHDIDDSKCPSCRERLTGIESETYLPVECPHCGNIYDIHLALCPKCGKALGELPE